MTLLTVYKSCKASGIKVRAIRDDAKNIIRIEGKSKADWWLTLVDNKILFNHDLSLGATPVKGRQHLAKLVAQLDSQIEQVLSIQKSPDTLKVLASSGGRLVWQYIPKHAQSKGVLENRVTFLKWKSTAEALSLQTPIDRDYLVL